jgi:hypothetical protein
MCRFSRLCLSSLTCRARGYVASSSWACSCTARFDILRKIYIDDWHPKSIHSHVEPNSNRGEMTGPCWRYSSTGLSYASECTQGAGCPRNKHHTVHNNPNPKPMPTLMQSHKFGLRLPCAPTHETAHLRKAYNFGHSCLVLTLDEGYLRVHSMVVVA